MTEQTAGRTSAPTKRAQPRTRRTTGSGGRSSASSNQGGASRPAGATATRHGLVIPVPVPEVHMKTVRLPSVGMPHIGAPSVGDGSVARLLWLGGLAALAVADVIAWPVAGVVAAGTYVAERQAKAASRSRGARAQ
jgi:hypothetical protein